MPVATELPTQPFASVAALEKWLSAHHASSNGIWIKVARKGSGIASVTWDEIVDVALCFGWIDGQRNGLDGTHFLQKITPRRARSIWSKRNIAKVAELEAAGRMKPTGRAEVERAKKDGRWDAAYGGSREMVVPEDFLKAVKKKSKKTQAFFNALKNSERFAISFRLHTAKKPETRARRFEALLAMLEAGVFK